MPQPVIENTSLVTTLDDEGQDAWTTVSLESKELIDNLYEHRIHIIATQLDEQSILEKPVTITFRPKDTDVKKVFHGYCIEISFLGMEANTQVAEYELVIAPWPWFLCLRQNCRVFQSKNVTEIITILSKEHGFHSDLSLETSQDPPIEYCIQYNESDWAFICRLLLLRGWYFFFQQQSKRHTLVIADNNRAFGTCSSDNVGYLPTGTLSRGAITQWSHKYRVVPTSCETADYNLDISSALLSSKAMAQRTTNGSAVLSHFTFPGNFTSLDEGNTVSKRTMTAFETDSNTVTGASCLPEFSAGSQFKLSEHPNDNEKQSYYLCCVEHSILAAEGHPLEYSNHFTCLPMDLPWVPSGPMVCPTLPNVQSAIVTGPSDEEVYLDQYHRIKIQFPWDREGKNDENSSCWIRVGQLMAGDGFGVQFTPRIGDEVLISFDAKGTPYIICSVYNGKRQAPYPTSTKLGFSAQSVNGGKNNRSEVCIDSKKDNELLYFLAERDWTVQVKNDHLATIQGESHSSVEKDATRTVKQNDSHHIEGEQTTDITKAMRMTIGENCQWKTSGNFAQETDGDCTMTIKGKTGITSTGNLVMQCSDDISASAKADVSLDAATIKADGKKGVVLTVGTNKISISASGIELLCGTSSVKLTSSGVEISGMAVNLEGINTATVKGDVAATVESSGITAVKGTLVEVN